LVEILEADGEVILVDDLVSRPRRKLRIAAAFPGYDLPLQATFEYEEWYVRGQRGWSMTDYQYEVRLQSAGRKAFHWHNGSHHVHCQDARFLRSADHYRGYEVDLLTDARPDLLRSAVAGAVDCSGLHIAD
jgi:hypothetical protein